MPNAILRLKLEVESVKRIANNQGNITQEEIALKAVYENREDSANHQWCKWTPYGKFEFTISNPEALGRLLPGQFYFVDLIPTDKDSL
jgi:hypothetical protein